MQLKRMYAYRIYPTAIQKKRLVDSLILCRQIYNELLELNIKTYAETGKGLRKFGYNRMLKGKHPELFSQVAQNVSDRVDKAFENFFRRLKDPACKKKGFPRFKSRVNSLTYPQAGFKFLSERRLYASKIGNIPLVLHRMPKGKIKTMTLKVNNAGQWFVIFSCEVDVPQIEHISAEKVGIDVGIESYATLSNGEQIKNPRHIVEAEKRLIRLQRKLSRKVKGSNNRRKARFLLAKQHVRVANQRKDFLHKLSHTLAQRYRFIAVEDLQINNMLKNHSLAKHIGDASWSGFIQMLSYKAVTSGGQLVKVNPRRTSRTCSKCGAIAEMPLKQRQFSCLDCGFTGHRDFNAALNILALGQDLPELTPVDDGVRPLLEAVVDESGTTHHNS